MGGMAAPGGWGSLRQGDKGQNQRDMESCSGRPVSILRRHLPHLLLHLLPFSLQVRKSSQEVLLALLEQGLISQCDIEAEVCPTLLERSVPSRDDECRKEAMSVSLPWE